jgi:hypothetical protein
VTRAERAITALREAADALDDLPIAVRRATILGLVFTSVQLRAEADVIERRMTAYAEATEATP